MRRMPAILEPLHMGGAGDAVADRGQLIKAAILIFFALNAEYRTADLWQPV